MFFRSKIILEDRPLWNSKALKPVRLLKVGCGFQSQWMSYPTPSLPSANLVKEAPVGILWGGDV